MLTNYRHLAIAAIIAAGLVVRFWNYPAYFGFDYDQEINAWIAKTIVVDHKAVLIGPETSVGGMYVGPFFNYVIALFFFLGKMDPLATISLNIFISALTVLAYFYFGLKIFSLRVGIIAAVIYAFSHLMITYDRILWNLTPLPLVSLGIVAFLWLYLEKKKLLYLAIASTLTAFSLHLHFTGLLLVAFFALSLLIFGRRLLWADKRSLVLISATFAFFFLPLVIFDLRHDLINSRHFIQFFLGNPGDKTSLSLTSFGAVALIFIGFFRAIFYRPLDFSQVTNMITVAFLLGFEAFVLFNIKKSPLIYKLILLFLAIPLLGFSFYHGALPSQYFLPELAVFILLAGGFLGIILKKSLAFTILVISALSVFAIYNIFQARADTNDLVLANKQSAVDIIVADAQNQTFKVDFITDPGLKTGFNYLFWQRGRKLIEDMSIPTQRNYKIVIPYYLVSSNELFARFGAIGVIRDEP